MDKRAVALVPAAGRGHRMGSSVPKQFLELGGLPLVLHSLRVLEASPSIVEIILAVPEADREYCLNKVIHHHGLKKVTKVVPGGSQRQDSVRHALAAATEEMELVLVHDAVRPFLTPEMVEKVLRRAEEVGAALIAIQMRDTVKRVGPDQLVKETVDRQGLWLAQTPQAFRASLLREVHRKAQLEGVHATDDAQLMERFGHPVAVVEGSGQNIKVTRPEDLAIGEAILAGRLHQEQSSAKSTSRG